MARRARVSPDRILAAAAVEFSERGFAGARVDRIARRARVNKAMLYYHFRSKQELYRTLLRRHFTLAAERLRAIAGGAGSPAEKLDRIVAGLAAFVREHESFPAIMLREVAEGGAHLDRETLLALVSVPQAFFTIVQDGVASGAFRAVHPVVAYFSTLAPVVFFLAAGKIRSEVTARHLMDLTAVTPDDFVCQLQESLRRALLRDPHAPTRSTP
jgi:TetR/AcrR family transcriptional regulator